MAKIYFDINCDLLMINGTVFNSSFLQADSGCIYGLIYTPECQGFIPLVSKLQIVKGKPIINQYACITECGDSVYIIKFLPQSYDKLLPPKSYFQSSLNSAPSHFLTAYKQGDYFISLETQQEIITIPTFDKLENITLKAHNISCGNLIFLSANLNSQKFLVILQYSGDYKIIFQAICESFVFCKDGLQIIDKVDDMLAHTIYRTFAYEGGIYIEKSRVFECRQTPFLIDELLPYAFVESAFCKDFDRCKTLCSVQLAESKMESIFGNFKGIVQKNYIPYIPRRLALSYDGIPHNYIKYFDFFVQDGKIVDIMPI